MITQFSRISNSIELDRLEYATESKTKTNWQLIFVWALIFAWPVAAWVAV